MDKIIVWGYGERYKFFSEEINTKYEIVGIYDSNYSLEYEKKISIGQLERLVNQSEVDAVLITPFDHKIKISICHELRINLMINSDKILFLDSEIDKDKIGRYMPVSGSYYGQWFDDIIIDKALLEMGIKMENFTYLEIGVYDPVIFSNTFRFYKEGAHGHLVDANINIKDLCEITRKRDIFYNFALVVESIDEVELLIPKNHDELAAISPETIILNGVSDTEIERIKVQTIRINDLLVKLSDIDFVSLDIEGMDLLVIKDWDFSRYRPKIMIIKNISEEIIRYMEEQNYRYYAKTIGNVIFTDKKFFILGEKHDLCH